MTAHRGGQPVQAARLYQEKRVHGGATTLRRPAVKCILDALREVADIAYWTLLPTYDPDPGESSCPPLNAWRYKDPSDLLEQFFRQAVDSFRGSIEWEIG
jgi:hypothetical protein